MTKLKEVKANEHSAFKKRLQAEVDKKVEKAEQNRANLEILTLLHENFEDS